MGTPVPPEPPEILDDKWYCCEVDAYLHPFPPFSCSPPYGGRFKKCVLGSNIKFWKSSGAECALPVPLVAPPTATVQRLVHAVGPYDTLGECIAGC